MGFAGPTEIQRQAIPPVLAGQDIIAASETGSGKTAAFVLPILDRINFRNKHIQVLVLTPTRELCRQVAEEVRKLGRPFSLRVTEIFGGMSYRDQRAEIALHPQVIAGAPGRVLDLMGNRDLDFSGLQVLILDEADRMVDMGFMPQIRDILAGLPSERQNLMFSATIPREVSRLAGLCMTDPVRIQVGRRARPPSQLVQEVVDIMPGEKASKLLEIVAAEPGTILIFTATKRGADEVHRALSRAGMKPCVLHSDCSQPLRKKAIDGFRAGKHRIMVATDIASRGLDIESIALVINYDLPDNPEDYVHRIGRTGRADAAGRALSFVTYKDYANLRNIERLTGHAFKSMAAPKRSLDRRANIRRKTR
jgi:ATP-dependent RNA helicase RhlE